MLVIFQVFDIKIYGVRLIHQFELLQILSSQVWVIGEFASSAHDSRCTVQNIVQYFEVYVFLSRVSERTIYSFFSVLSILVR